MKDNTTAGLSAQGAPTLAHLAEQQLLKALSTAVDLYQSRASYCCGGTVPIANPSVTHNTPKTQDAISLRWDTTDDYGSARKVEFPVVNSADQVKAQALFEELLRACVPATFGRNNEDILNETYRKAGKLDRDQFSVDFHPSDYGIVSSISQILLPQIYVPDFLKEREEHRGVRAELYKVNIYSAPSGKFQAHVDTPRGPTQFGSLVVCLPHPHEGGQLRVTHKGHSTIFDWSNSDQKHIQWSAFYSDCEHEVLEVKAGHRVTLTYNLYVTEQVGRVLRPNPAVDPSLFPFYEGAKQMIAQPNLMERGGTLGFYCSYKYAHHTKEASALLPWALKGIDIIIFSVFRSLGLNVVIRPILGWNSIFEYPKELRRKFHKAEHGDDSDYEEYDPENLNCVGTVLHELAFDSTHPEGRDEESVPSAWPYEEFMGIEWLNSPRDGHEELAIVGLSYGNQADLDWTYSHAAILVTVPSRGARGTGMANEATVPSAQAPLTDLTMD